MTGPDLGMSARWPGPHRLLCVVLGVVAVSSACAQRGLAPVGAPAGSGAPPTPVVESSEDGRQALFRVRYRGLDGRGRVRLTLRVASEDSYRLSAADAFGRALWSFSGDDDSSLLVDERRREFCRFDGDVALPAIALANLPVRLLPRILLGEAPVPLGPEAQPGEIERIDPDGRRWTIALDASLRPERWTLWEGSEAIVWYRVGEGGAILSHRDGAQVLWTVVADETTAVGLPALGIPDGFVDGSCDANDVP